MTAADNIPTRSPFTADNLALALNNDGKACPAFRSLLKSLVRAVDRTADACAKEAAEWHDDPTSDDHAAFHAPARIQYPRPVRRGALLDLIEQHLDAIDENEGARFWPEDFRALKPGDVVTLNDGTPAVVETAPHGLGNAWVTVAYHTEPGGPVARRDVEWQDLTKNV